jgi:predicted RNase H-like nuclease (RuvC/YqgF family)
MPDHNNHGFSSNHRSNGSSHNNKTTKVDPKDAQIDSLKTVIGQLQLDTTRLSANVGALTVDTANLHKQLVQQSIKYQRDVKSLNEQLTSLNQQLTTAKENQSMFTVFATPYGCSILIVLILALTMIALKKGFSVSKGDTNISVGDKK